MFKKKVSLMMMCVMTAATVSACGNAASDDQATTTVSFEAVSDVEGASQAEESATGEAAQSAAADEDYSIDIIEDEEGFMPSDFLQYRLQKDEFESYDEVISNLEAGEGYTYIQLAGYEGDLLVIAEKPIEFEGTNQSSEVCIYGVVDGKAVNIGNVYSDGSAYPVMVGNGLIYAEGNHMFEASAINTETNYLSVQEYVFETSDADGKTSYTGFTRDIDKLNGDTTDTTITTPEEFAALFDTTGREIINFTVK